MRGPAFGLVRQRYRLLIGLAGLVLLGNWAVTASTRPTPPYLLLHDWYGESPVASPSYIRDHREYLDSLPFDGIVTYVRSEDLAVNVSARILGAEAVSEKEIESCLAPLKGLQFRRLKENFAAVLAGRPPDFMADWSVTAGNFARLARAARETGLRGIYFDNETYKAPWANHPDGVAHPYVELGKYQDQARRRGREVMEAMAREFPGIVVIVLHGPYISEPRAPAPLFPDWQTANELLGPFFAGFVEGARDGATVVDGGQLYHLRQDREFRESYEWRKSSMPSNCPFIPAATQPEWRDRVRYGFGVYDRAFKGHDMNPGILATTLAHALKRSDSYVWLYVEGPSFLKPPEQGGASRDWVEAVRKARRQN